MPYAGNLTLADVAERIRLARYFGTTPQFWLNLQMKHNLTRALSERGQQIEATVQPRAA